MRKEKVKKSIYKRIGFIALAVIFVMGTTVGCDDTSKDTTDKKSEETKEVEKKKEVEQEQVEKKEESKKVEEVDGTKVIDEVNKQLKEHIEMSQGWALGELDDNGNPTENGEPNEDFAGSLYIQKLKYNGSDLELYVDGGFSDLSDSEKKTIVNNAIDSANAFIGSAENWDSGSSKYQTRVYVTIYNGENALGHSKISDPFDFKWYN